MNILNLLPSKEELDKQLKSIRKKRAYERRNPSEKLQKFQKIVSLKHWLSVCEKANIPFIPAEFSNDIKTDEIFKCLDNHKNLKTPTLNEAIRWLQSNLKEGYMWRWDVCAPYEVKSDMDEGKEHTSQPLVCVDDPRFIDILHDVNRISIPIAIRPWIRAFYVKKHPVEFRVYVFEKGEPAVSNYYPQRNLSKKWEGRALQAVEMAKKLVPHAPHNEFSADFLLKENGEMVFLEGGPWWGSGCHPCCFNPKNLIAGAIALRKQN